MTTSSNDGSRRPSGDTTRQASGNLHGAIAAVCEPSDAPTVAEPNVLLGPSFKRAIPRANRFASIPSRYEVIGEVGRGGMGIVYKVRDLETCEILALKILKPEIAADQTMRENLRREVCLARKVTHKNVCRIHDFTRTDSTACISMEFVDGESLLCKMQRRGALLPADAVEIAEQICAGLREAHAQGIIHRDLKPANIVIAADKTVKIMDFGVAQMAHDADPDSEMLAGTPVYMAPEQLELKPLSPRTDIYALGLMLYEMVTGARAFSANTASDVAMAQINHMPQRPSEIVATISPRLEAIVLKCLEKDPAKRFASVEELQSSLARLNAPKSAVLREAALDGAKQAALTVGQDAWGDLSLLGRIVKRLAERFWNTTQPRATAWAAAIHNYDWRTNPRRRVHMALAAGSLAALALSVAAAIRHEMHAPPHPPARGAATSLIAANDSVSPEPRSLFNEHEFDFAPLAAPAGNPEPAQFATHDASAVRANSWQTARSANGAQPVRSAAVFRGNAIQPATLQNVAARPAPLASAYSVETEGGDALSALTIPDELSTAANAATLNPGADNSEGGDSSPKIEETYLEVGTFNDALWADQAMSQLTQMGFHAIAVHKTVLWSQSYRVQVGPFRTQTELLHAETALEARGFKPRAVK